MRALVVDDERLARNRLKRMLARVDGVEVVGEASDGRGALVEVDKTRPTLIFLDIRMPGMNGLEVARRLPQDIHIVFTTAYDEYALQAFETSAIDYLLKPIEAERLESTVAKLIRLAPNQSNRELERLVRAMASRNDPPRLSARRGGTVHVFDPRQITRLHAKDRYLVLRHEGQEYLLDDSIRRLEKLLADWGFLRVHRSELINLECVESLSSEDDVVFVTLSDGQRATVSRRHLRALKERLGIVGR